MTIEGTNNQLNINQHSTQQQNTNREADKLCQIAVQQIAHGEHSQALGTYQQAVKISPVCITAYIGMADLFKQHGNRNHALQLLSHALKIEPENSRLRRQMSPLLAELTPTSYSAELERDLLLCISEPNTDHQLLARVISAHLSNKYLESQKFNDANIAPELLQSLATDALFLAYLTRCINTHANIEHWLTQLRRTLLLTSHNQNELVCALALQCFANEYIFAVSEDEEQRLASIEKKIRTTTNFDVSPALLLACMYRPLYYFSIEKISIEYEQQPYLALLVKRTLLDLQQEQQHQNSIKKIGEITSSKGVTTISDQVRIQYEESPYPRWQIPPVPAPMPLAQILHQLPAAKREFISINKISVLIAGCGTGFEPIELARMDKGAQITALDLSSKSLAYARRMADELQISNVDFIQGNILDATQLHKKFDLIHSTGVLHHMENPQAGWQILCGILRPGGIMRISLYSELARRRIVLAHQRIRELQHGSSNRDIKKFRAYIFSQPSGSPLAELAQSDDFYSLSGCRDLLFHVQEHRFTLLQLKMIIAELGLTVVGFDTPTSARQQFRQYYPDTQATLDLEKWHEFETRHPDTFVGMYQLWLQKQ